MTLKEEIICRLVYINDGDFNVVFDGQVACLLNVQLVDKIIVVWWLPMVSISMYFYKNIS